MKDNACNCSRCGVKLKINPVPGSKARMLRRSATSKGLCVNCAAHDWLRNTYQVNLLLARTGPQCLAIPHIQQQFAAIMRVACADAVPDEICWSQIIANWDLPFATKIKATATNPVTQKELDREKDRRLFLTAQETRAKAAAARDWAMREGDADKRVAQ